MGLPWLKVSSDLPNHPKSLDLAAELGEPRAWTYVLELWLWCGRSAPDGRIAGKHPVAMVERAAGWTGEPGALAGALERVGLLDRDGEAFQVHDWAEHNAAHQAKLERDRAHAAKRRKESRTVSEESQRVASDSSASRPQIAGEIERETEKKKQLPASQGAPSAPAPGGSGPEGDHQTQPAPGPKSEKTSDSEPSRGQQGDQQKAPKPKKPSAWQELREDMRARRERALPGALPDVELKPAVLNTTLQRLTAEISARHGVSLLDAYEEFLRDDWALKRDPPCPLTLFVAQAPKYASAAKRRAPAANTPPAEGCAGCGGAPWGALRGGFHGGVACQTCVTEFGADYMDQTSSDDTWACYRPPAAEAWRAWCERKRAA